MHWYSMDWQPRQLAIKLHICTLSNTCAYAHRQIGAPLYLHAYVMSVCQSNSTRQAPHHNSGTPWIPELPMEHSMHQWTWHPMDRLWQVCKWYSLEANMLHYHTSSTSHHTDTRKWIGAHICKPAHIDTRIYAHSWLHKSGCHAQMNRCPHMSTHKDAWTHMYITGGFFLFSFTYVDKAGKPKKVCRYYSL